MLIFEIKGSKPTHNLQKLNIFAFTFLLKDKSFNKIDEITQNLLISTRQSRKNVRNKYSIKLTIWKTRNPTILRRL